MLNQEKCPRTQQLEGGGTERERERGGAALDGILMGTPAVCKDCLDIGVFKTV